MVAVKHLKKRGPKRRQTFLCANKFSKENWCRSRRHGRAYRTGGRAGQKQNYFHANILINNLPPQSTIKQRETNYSAFDLSEKRGKMESCGLFFFPVASPVSDVSPLVLLIPPSSWKHTHACNNCPKMQRHCNFWQISDRCGWMFNRTPHHLQPYLKQVKQFCFILHFVVLIKWIKCKWKGIFASRIMIVLFWTERDQLFPPLLPFKLTRVTSFH